MYLEKEIQEKLYEIMDEIEEEKDNLRVEIERLDEEMNFYSKIFQYPFLKFLLNRKSWRGVHFCEIHREDILNVKPDEYEYNGGLNHWWHEEKFHIVLSNDEVIEDAVKPKYSYQEPRYNNIKKGETVGEAINRLNLSMSEVKYVIKEEYHHNENSDYKGITLYIL